MTMKIHAELAIAFLLCGAAGAGETRMHYSVVRRDHTPAYFVTVITDTNQQRSQRRHFISDVHGPLLDVESMTDYAANVSWTRYRNGRTGKWVKVSYELPFTSRTLDGRRAEVKANPALADAPITVSVSSARGVVRALESDLKPGRAARDRVKALIDDDVREAIVSLRGVFGLPMFTDAAAMAPFLIDGPATQRSQELMVATVPPDCAFDAKWGAPCSPAQVRAIHAAIASGKAPTAY